MQLFVVCGYSGSRSNEDNSSWNVKAFSSFQLATAFAERLNRRVTRLLKSRDSFEARFGYDSYRYEETRYFTRYGEPKPDRLDPGRVWAWEVPRYEVETIEAQL